MRRSACRKSPKRNQSFSNLNKGIFRISLPQRGKVAAKPTDEVFLTQSNSSSTTSWSPSTFCLQNSTPLAAGLPQEKAFLCNFICYIGFSTACGQRILRSLSSFFYAVGNLWLFAAREKLSGTGATNPCALRSDHHTMQQYRRSTARRRYEDPALPPDKCNPSSACAPPQLSTVAD